MNKNAKLITRNLKLRVESAKYDEAPNRRMGGRKIANRMFARYCRVSRTGAQV